MTVCEYLGIVQFIYRVLHNMHLQPPGMKEDLLLDAAMSSTEVDRLYSEIETHFALQQQIVFTQQSNTIRNLIILIRTNSSQC